MLPKAESVTSTGEPDGFVTPRCWRRDVQGDGSTRLVVSVPAEELEAMHLRLIGALGEHLGVLYVQLTDRKRGQLPSPVRRIAVEVPAARVVAALQARRELIWGDGRHQLWIRGKFRDQVVLDELGMLYCYPDDPAFRDLLAELPQRTDLTIDTRDYVKVQFLPEADAQEESLLDELSLRPWG